MKIVITFTSSLNTEDSVLDWGYILLHSLHDFLLCPRQEDHWTKGQDHEQKEVITLGPFLLQPHFPIVS